MALVIPSTRLAPLEVEIDGWDNEAHHQSMHITTYPIERNESAVEHVARKPANFSGRGYVSDIRFAGSERGDRPREAWEALVALMDEAEPFEVVTRFATYERMLMHDLQAVSESGQRALFFTCQFQEVLVPDRPGADAIVPAAGSETADRVAQSNIGRGVIQTPTLAQQAQGERILA